MRLLISFFLLQSMLAAAELRFAPNGELKQVCRDIHLNFAPPNPLGAVVELDEDTNVALLADASDNTSMYSFSGGVLLKNGQPVTINGDGSLKISLEQAKALWDAIKTQAAFDALTAAQKAEALRRANKMIILLLVKEGILSPQDFQ